MIVHLRADKPGPHRQQHHRDSRRSELWDIQYLDYVCDEERAEVGVRMYVERVLPFNLMFGMIRVRERRVIRRKGLVMKG